MRVPHGPHSTFGGVPYSCTRHLIPGHNLSGFASQFATQSYPCANQSQNASQVIANQSETGLLRLYPSKDYGLRFPGGGPRGFWPAQAGSLQRCIKAMANILSIRYN